MTDYTLTLTQDELDELDRIVRMQSRADSINLICNKTEKGTTKAVLKARCAIQSKLVGKLMDIQRKSREICPERDPDNPLLPRRERSEYPPFR